MIKRFLVLTMHTAPTATPSDSFGTFDSFDTREEAERCAAALTSSGFTVLAVVETPVPFQGWSSIDTSTN